MLALLAVLQVVSSIPTLGSLAKEVGGNRVNVESLGKGYQDPHFVEPKPNLMLVLNLPTTKVDRSMGDIHPQGNPHYWLPPGNAKIIAREIAQRLEELDPEGRADYEKNLAAFVARVDAKLKEWAPMV